jgi:hypothetical protein
MERLPAALALIDRLLLVYDSPYVQLHSAIGARTLPITVCRLLQLRMLGFVWC